MTDSILVYPDEVEEVGLENDPVLEDILLNREVQRDFLTDEGQDRDAPLALQIAKPRAIDLRKFWALTNQPVPPIIEASLGPNTPILLAHVVTPFPKDGKSPRQVWGLGYEFVVDKENLTTVSVLPSDEVYQFAKVNQKLEVGLQLGGGVGIPESTLGILENVPGINLTGAELKASTDQKFQISIKMQITLRKVIAAPVGSGGAKWQMYRQDEPLDRPHTLLQTILISSKTKQIHCTIKTWAKQAGLLGSELGAKFWHYKDQDFKISLSGSSPK